MLIKKRFFLIAYLITFYLIKMPSLVTQNTSPLLMPTIEESLTTDISSIPEMPLAPELPGENSITINTSQTSLQMPLIEIPTESQPQTEPKTYSSKDTTLINTNSTTTIQQKNESIPQEKPSQITQKTSENSQHSDKKTETIQISSNKKIPEKLIIKKQDAVTPTQELDFEVENSTGRTIFIVCFIYLKKRPFSRWRWDKSPTYKLENNQIVKIDLDTIPDNEDRASTFGYLGVFEDEKSANRSTFELLDDHQKIDLDLVSQLKNKKVVIEVEKYGIAGEFYEYDFKDKTKEKESYPELDFYAENKTGKTIFVTCFVYQKKAKGSWLAKKTKEAWTFEEDARDDMSVWRFDKTPVIKLKPNQISKIDVDTIVEKRDREYVRGYLAVFDENEKDKAEKSVYELLPMDSRKKIELGRLINIKDKKVIIYIETYGIMGDFIDYVVKLPRKPDITKIVNKGI